MSNVVSLKWQGTAEMRAAFKRMDDAAAGRTLGQCALAGINVLETHIKLNIHKQKLVDTGNLANNWSKGLERADKDGAVAYVGTNTEYAGIHEYGGTITARNAKFLTIPVSDEARKAGSARAFGELVFIPTDGGETGLLVQPTGRGEFIVHFRCVKSVRIPARPYMRPAGDEHGQDAMNAVAVTWKRLTEAGTK